MPCAYNETDSKVDIELLPSYSFLLFAVLTEQSKQAVTVWAVLFKTISQLT